MERSCRIAYSTGIEAHINDQLFDLRRTPSVVVVEQKAVGGARLILAQITLGSACGFAPFDNLITVAMRTLNGDERRHGLFLGEGWGRDLAHSDIDSCPSPRLEHYLILNQAADCDLIVLGSRGVLGWKRLFAGSIINAVAAKATQPVAVVKTSATPPAPLGRRLLVA